VLDVKEYESDENDEQLKLYKKIERINIMRS
jgi:hypothetical protein